MANAKPRTVSIRLTDAEYHGINLDAKDAGKTVSLHLREILSAYLRQWEQFTPAPDTETTPTEQRSYKSEWD